MKVDYFHLQRVFMHSPLHMTSTPWISALILGLLSSCQPTPIEWEEVTPPSPTLRRLTQVQYKNTIRDLLGETVVLPAQLEPDSVVAGSKEVGASVTTISTRGVEQYEDAAYSLATQILEDESIRNKWITCAPDGMTDDNCAGEILNALGEQAWRRPLTGEELNTLVVISRTGAEALESFDKGLEYGLATLFQSPHFLFRTELGEPDPDHPGTMRYTDYEMAHRLSYFLWNTTPDAELMAAAAAGELTQDAGLEVQVERLLEDVRAREGVATFFTDLYQLYRLDNLPLDPTIFTHMSADVGPSAREETLAGIDALIFDEDGDYRDLLVTRETAINRTLAAIYDVPAPVRDGFGWTELPKDGPRAGLLGQVSFLSLHSHPVSTSATLRGMFIRETLLCQKIPAPPSEVDTSIPEPSGDAPTLRDRVAEHLENDFCASCHVLTDPMGLAFEQFDALGRFRLKEVDTLIDPSGDLEGTDFETPRELADLLRDHPRLGPCLVERLHTYATGHELTAGEESAKATLDEAFQKSRYRVKGLLKLIVMNPTFRKTSPVSEEVSE